MKIVITGATGFVGSELGLALAREGHELVVLSRDPGKALDRLPFRATAFSWKAETEEAPLEALKNADAVVHLAGDSVAGGRWTPARKKSILNSRVLGTRNLVSTIGKLPATERPKKLISASAIGFYGNRGDEMLNESSQAGDGFLAQVCREWEAEAHRAENHGVAVAIVRIGVVLGHSGGALAQMLPLFRKGVGGALGDGKQYMSAISLNDLVRAFVFLIRKPELIGTFNGVGPEATTNQAFTETLARLLESRVFMAAPRAALELALGEMASVVLASQRVTPLRLTEAGFTFSSPTLEAALKKALLLDQTQEKHFEIIETRQFIPAKLETVFSFFSDAKNLENITPEFLNFKIVKQSTPEIQEGTLIDYSLKIRGLPAKWKTLIEKWEPNRSFVDRQLSGPYSLWHHTHEFESLQGGTLMTDRVLYRLPMGFLGRAIAGSFVKKDVTEIFGHRWNKVREIYGSPS